MAPRSSDANDPAIDPAIDAVIDFWFGPGPVPTQATSARWFTRDAAFDAEIRERFGALLAEAAAGGSEGWRGTARGELALIVVLDQLSRNAYRDDPRAFAQDARALAIARELLESGRARALTYHQRWVALLPFMHAEDRAVQAASVAAYDALVEEARAAGAPGAVVAALTSALDYARKHAVIVERFGRFPHRNEVLGRASTPEELAFLEQPGSRF